MEIKEKPLTPGCVVAIHCPVHHPDDVFSVAVLSLIEPTIKIIRTRDEDLLKSADFRVDVGGRYDCETGDYDHHQPDFMMRHLPPTNPRYTEGPKYAAFGLIWKHFGDQLISYLLAAGKYDYSKECVEFVFNQIERLLVSSIDAVDNGEANNYYLDSGGFKLPTIGKLITNIFPTWIEQPHITDEDMDKYFHEAKQMAMTYLKREIMKQYSVFMGRDTILTKLEESSDPILVLDTFVPWGPIFTKYGEKAKHIKMVVYPSNDTWMCQSPYYNWKLDTDLSPEYKNGTPRKLRCPAPESICGLTNDELVKITGIPDLMFCHVNGFLSVAKTFESIMSLASWIIDHQNDV